MRLLPAGPGAVPVRGVSLVVDRVRALLAADGGCTLSRCSGRRLAHGLAVCADPEAAWDFAAGDWDDRLVRAHVLALIPSLEARDAHLGAWLDPCSSQVWIEPVWVVPAGARSWAEAIGRRHRQRAIYDLGRDRLVPLGAGSGACS